MNNELLHIGPFTLYGYGFMIGIGVLCGWFAAQWRASRRKMDADFLYTLCFWSLVGGFGGAKLLFWICQWREIIIDPSFILWTMGDGFVVYGGIIGGIFTAWLCCRRRKEDFLKWLDLVLPSVALGQGFGRIGCFLAGCCYGRETDHLPYVIFHSSEFAPNGVKLVPSQIYFSVLNFVNVAVLIRLSGKNLQKGKIASLYLLNYSVGRFFLEWFRGDPERGFIGPLSTSQFLSVLTALAGILLWYSVRKDSMDTV